MHSQLQSGRAFMEDLPCQTEELLKKAGVGWGFEPNFKGEMPCTQCEEKPYCNRAVALQWMAGSAIFPSGCLDEGQGLVFLHRSPYSSDLGKCKGRCTLAIFGPFPPAVGWPGHGEGGGWGGSGCLLPAASGLHPILVSCPHGGCVVTKREREGGGRGCGKEKQEIVQSQASQDFVPRTMSANGTPAHTSLDLCNLSLSVMLSFEKWKLLVFF